MKWPALAFISEEHGSPICHGIYTFRDKAQETIKSLLPNLHAVILSGILLGNDNELSPDLDDAFRTTGLTHIIANSGMMEMMFTIIR
jgi:predicted membrane metal-binding protein